jgi:hypothetical protein
MLDFRVNLKLKEKIESSICQAVGSQNIQIDLLTATQETARFTVQVSYKLKWIKSLTVRLGNMLRYRGLSLFIMEVTQTRLSKYPTVFFKTRTCTNNHYLT